MSYVPITYPEIKKYLFRTWSGFSPSESSVRGERVVDIKFDDSGYIGVRVFTSIGSEQVGAAPVGEDAIRVGLYNFKNQRPMTSGKFPIVKRTTGWRGNLDDRIQEFLDMYLSRQPYWESRLQWTSS